MIVEKQGWHRDNQVGNNATYNWVSSHNDQIVECRYQKDRKIR